MDIKTGRFLITGLLILGAIVGSGIALADLRDGYIPTTTDQTDRSRPDSFANLVQVVARLHGATVTLTDQVPGLTVGFILPRHDDEAL